MLIPPPRVIVTRPLADAQRWVAQLRQAGLQAQALPLIEITAPQDPKALYQAWCQIDQYAALMFVSRQAVAHFFAAKPAGAQAASGLRYLVPGQGTRAALLNLGVPAPSIDAPALDAPQFDSQALWQVVSQRVWDKQRVLLVHGESLEEPTQRNWLMEQLQAAGAQVEGVAAYQRHVPSLSAAQWQLAQEAVHDGSVWLFSSSQALANLATLNQRNVPPLDWLQARALATHPRITQALQRVGWGVVALSRSTVPDIVASIESLAL